MKLLTKEIVKKMPALYETEEQGNDAPIIVKFFAPDSNWTWWIKEASAVDHYGNYHRLSDHISHVMAFVERKPIDEPIEDIIMFGLVDGFDRSLGYVSLKELMSIRGKLGLPIERDMHFNGRTIKEMM